MSEAAPSPAPAAPVVPDVLPANVPTPTGGSGKNLVILGLSVLLVLVVIYLVMQHRKKVAAGGSVPGDTPLETMV